MEAILAAKFTEILKSAGGVLAAVAITARHGHESTNSGIISRGKALGFKTNEFPWASGRRFSKNAAKNRENCSRFA